MHRIVPALDRARETRSRKAKVRAIADALAAAASDDDELATAARLVAGEVLARREGLVIGVGRSLLVSAAATAFGLVPEDLVATARTLGDLGDAVGELAARVPEAETQVGLTIGDVDALARSLAATSDRAAKESTLAAAFARARPDHARYLTKILLGELRVGVRGGILEEAIALAFDADLAEVQGAAILCPDPGELVLLARHGELTQAAFRLGEPVASMLASPVENVKAPLEDARTIWEDKLDGIRVQAHARPGDVRLFARGGGEVTAVFPELTAALGRVPSAVVLDGEILAVVRGAPDLRPRPFQALQARLNRPAPPTSLLETTPVALFAFDILYDGESLLALAWTDRRARLDRFFASADLGALAQATLYHRLDASQPVDEQVAAAYAEARARGHEGIVLKNIDAPYEAGRRGSAWRKVKRAFATLDVVITRAERGHGKRAKVLSDYTFGVWDEGALVDIGKAYSGLTDAEIAALTKELEATTLGHAGHQRLVRPTVVLEIAFDGIQSSTRHRSGFALRFPRIVRIRTDKQPEDADTLTTARALFESQLASGHREEIPAAPEQVRAAPSRKARATLAKGGARAPTQLGLFGDDD